MNLQRVTLLLCWVFLCLDLCLSQKDCTGVDCPVLQSCIEEVLGVGSCCATCARKGCTCEGYQYYDCVHAGFQKGKVPEGESYFVDFGSTECSCPHGGGKIACHFIPCPDIPPNCIEIIKPKDGCLECGRIGCIRGTKKYDAGHTFQMDPCQVCHCPNDGGSLMCSSIPGCDQRSSNKTMLGTTTENKAPLRDFSGTLDSKQTNPLHPFSKLVLGNTLPLYKQDPPSFGTEEYDYTLAEPTSSTPLDVAQQRQSTTAPPTYPKSSFVSSSFRDGGTEVPSGEPENRDQQRRDMAERQWHTEQLTAGARRETATSLATTTQRATEPVSERTIRHHGDRDRVAEETLKDKRLTTPVDQGVRHSGHDRDNQKSSSGGHGRSRPHSHKGQGEAFEEEQHSYPTVQFSPTRTAPIRMKEEGDKPKRQAQTLHDYQNGKAETNAAELLSVCCETGEKWATANGHCNNMPLPAKDKHSVCRIAQKRCCLGPLSEQQCAAGINAAKSGALCEEDDGDKCGADSYKECCGCCALGLRFRTEGHGCDAQRPLGSHCTRIFLTCCAGEAREVTAPTEGYKWHPVRERPVLDSTPQPKKVSDSPFPKEAFSIGEEQENAVEGPFKVEDMNECLVYQGNLCHHRCVNTPGSFRCECYGGYTLQDDGVTCAEGTMDEENRLREDDRAAAEQTTLLPPPPPPTPQPTDPPNPCEGNGPCAQQCTPVEGRPHCSCFPGFYLKADGRSCDDINECLSARACQLNERCANTVGSYTCQRQIVCPLGFQINNDICEDIDECVKMTHDCGPGFECVNTEGSFMCTHRPQCAMGLTRDALGNCVDIDECSSVSQPCSPGFNCINTVGSYSCQRKILMCSRGYHASPDGSGCIDVDECQSSLHRCGQDQLCHNLPGSYRCDCQPGYQYDSFRRMCVDVNECWRYPGRLCAQTCENTPGSYECSCTVGFRLSSDGKNCEDVDECLANPCSQECANVYGSYQCYCSQGYYLRGDGHSCEDIDECSQSVGHLCSYKCVNVPGSYQCVCPEFGYAMSPNGRSCRDIDECTVGAHNCSLAETCYNIQGGYRCLAFECPQNYRKVSDTRCERISCPNHLDCQNSPMRITYYYLSFQSNIILPAQIFRIGPSPAYSGDNVIISIARGNEENFFGTRKLNAYTGAVYLHRQVRDPRDFLIDVEMKLWRQGTFTTFLARIYVFITANSL